MIAVPISGWAVAWFELRRILVFLVAPALVGFAVAVLYPIGQRMAAQHRRFVLVTVCGAIGPAAMLFGWTLVVRTQWTAVPYGLGYGLGIACLSRVHKLRFWPPGMITRSQAARR